MRTNELLNSSVDDEEVVDEAFEVVAVDSAQRADGLPSIRLHMVEQMQSVFVGIRFKLEEADAAVRSRRWLHRWRPPAPFLLHFYLALER